MKIASEQLIKLLTYPLTWLQMILILTKSVNRCFEKNPKFDMTPLLGGTDVVFSSLIHSFGWYVPLFSLSCSNAYTLLYLKESD